MNKSQEGATNPLSPSLGLAILTVALHDPRGTSETLMSLQIT